MAVAYAQGLLIFVCAVTTAVVGLLALLFRRRWLAEAFVVTATVTLVAIAWPSLIRALGLKDERPTVTPTDSCSSSVPARERGSVRSGMVLAS